MAALFVPHKTVSTVKAPFSPGSNHIIPKPGLRPSSSSSAKSSPTRLPVLLAMPIATAHATPYEDEFIELYNAGSVPISLAGWRLADSSPKKHHFYFPADAVIAPHSYILIFGGGKPMGFIVPRLYQ